MTDGWVRGVGRGDGPSRLVEHIQHLIINHGYSLSPHGADGRFGQLTESRVREFQLAADLPVTGVVDRATFDALSKEATVKAKGIATPHRSRLTTDVPDAPGPADGPPPPPFPPLVGNDQRAAIFGRISYAPAPTSTCPEGIRILGNWTEEHICTALVPQLAMIPGVEHHGSLVAQGPASGHVLVHKLIRQQLVDLWQAWEDAQLLDRILTWHGLWAPRFIRGSRTVLSNHAYATAFDINAPWNALGAKPAPRGTRGSVVELVALAHKHGFFWGGHFRRTDGMHFEAALVS